MSAASTFEYSHATHTWRHGPIGYLDYESYREWLRDEFAFRCVFCLRREQWNIRHGCFHLDHFVPQSSDPSLGCKYENLLYVCAACNLKKSDLAVPHPSAVAVGDCVRVHSDGSIEALNADGELLIDLLRLDDADCTRYRKMLLETLMTLEQHNRGVFNEWMRFPDDLPNLSLPRPPGGNSCPAGITESWFARRERGELPKTY
jgi:hypothetical protein